MLQRASTRSRAATADESIADAAGIAKTVDSTTAMDLTGDEQEASKKEATQHQPVEYGAPAASPKEVAEQERLLARFAAGSAKPMDVDQQVAEIGSTSDQIEKVNVTHSPSNFSQPPQL